MSTSAADQILNAEGLVKWFDPKKGFGFIVGPDGQDIFAHYTKIDGEGFRVLKDGTAVIYDAVRGEKGWHATRIALQEASEEPVRARQAHGRSPRR